MNKKDTEQLVESKFNDVFKDFHQQLENIKSDYPENMKEKLTILSNYLQSEKFSEMTSFFQDFCTKNPNEEKFVTEKLHQMLAKISSSVYQ